MGKTRYQKKYRENKTDEQKQKDYQKKYRENIEKLKNIDIII